MNPNNGNYVQNGGQPSLSARNVLPVKNKNKDNVCRDYVWGKCNKAQCKFVHECDLQTMLNILHFCHDYQNSTGCKRQNCTFLHATREEEKLFREKSQFPQDLLKRHRQMHATFAGMSRKLEEMSCVNKPPPPPHENQQGPPPMLMVNPMYQTAPRWFLQPPPPPPPREPSPPPTQYSGPPPPAAVVYQTQPVMPPPSAPSAYSHPILHQFDTSKPPPPFLLQVKNGSMKRPDVHEGSPPKITPTQYIPQPVPDALSTDTSKPPPPLFPTVQQAQNILGKRPHAEGFDQCEAGPSKRKTSNSQTSTCENCTRWELRNLLLETKLSEKIAEKACAVLKYEEKKNEIANIVDLLSCLAMPQSDTSNSVSDISTPLDDTLLRAFVANHMKEKPNFVPKPSANNVLRRITEILKDSDTSSNSNTNGNISQGLERLLDLDLDLHRPEPPQQAVSVPTPHSFVNSVVSTHSAMPPMSLQFTQAPQSHRHLQHQNYQFPGPSNGPADMNKPATSSNAPIQAAPVLPPYGDPNMYYMMGRPPPPFQ